MRPLLAALLVLIFTACTPGLSNRPTAAPPTAVPSTAVPPTAVPPTSTSEAPATIVPAITATVVADTSPLLAPTAGPTPIAPVVELAAIDAARRTPRDQVELARALGPCRADPAACPTVARSTPLEVQVGETRAFYVANIDDDTNREISAELHYIGPVVLMYVEVGLSFDQADLEQAARRFEQEVYPRTRAIFGSESQPGVDGDQRITILNASSPGGGVLGYFAARDSVPRQVNRFSNEREMFFMNLATLSFDDPSYVDVLSHEFQHMIQRNEQPSTTTWFNEGSSMLSADLNGFVDQGYVLSYLFRPDTQLTGWADAPGQSIPHYGAAQLFMRYIFAQYAEERDLLGLVRANAGVELESFAELAARRRPDVDSFGALFADWAVANLLNDPAVGDGRYSYPPRPGLPELLNATIQPVALEEPTTEDDVAQYGADYFTLPAGPLALSFQGEQTVNLVGERPRAGYGWWSGRGDNSFSTLTRMVDLSAVTAASLSFDAWYEIESDYDYAFVTVSTDDGLTWETLATTGAVNSDPQGHNYGYGLTGISGTTARTGDGLRGSWVEERADLSAYAGKPILLRFWQISDEGYNAPGLLIDNLRIPEIGFSDDSELGENGWQAEGFVRVDGDLAQQWALRLVRTATDGKRSVEPLLVDAAGQASAALAAGEQGVIIIAAVTPYTTERAGYTLTVE